MPIWRRFGLGMRFSEPGWMLVAVRKVSKRKESLLSDPFLDKVTLSFARQALRRASYRWAPRNEAIKAARVARGLYKCAGCGSIVPNKEKELDHVESVIRTDGDRQSLGEFAARLFAPRSGWQILCIPCHRVKSERENQSRRRKRD
jgi:5-methylcytosine-specific restriction endonuclease McrA